jgi:hypothetical protein
MHYNDEGILIQSLEHPRELPVRPSAEQAVKVPLQPLQGSGGSAKCDKQSSFHHEIWLNFPKIHQENHLESMLAPRTMSGCSTVLIAYCFAKLC